MNEVNTLHPQLHFTLNNDTWRSEYFMKTKDLSLHGMYSPAWNDVQKQKPNQQFQAADGQFKQKDLPQISHQHCSFIQESRQLLGKCTVGNREM